jgi:hypothetical protein
MSAVTHRKAEEAWRCYIVTHDDRMLLGWFATATSLRFANHNIPLVQLGVDDTSDPLGGCDQIEALALVLDSLIADFRHSAFLQFGRMSLRHCQAVIRVAQARGLRYSCAPSGTAYHFDTAGPIDDIRGRMSKSFRRTFNRQRRRLRQNWSMDFLEVRSRDAVVNHQLFTDFVGIEAKGWKAATGSALSNQVTWRNYYEQWVLDASIRGEARWYQLRADGAPIAAYLCFSLRDRIWAAKTAYDPEWSSYSPGNDLLMRVLEAACADPRASRVHMITGPKWLQKWPPDPVGQWELRVFTPSWRGRICSAALRAKRTFSDSCFTRA